MKNVWTREQQEAISERNENFLVAAAAGAGKTAVLVERIIKRITDEENPADIDKLLVVTFTNAAATEMRERIGDAISKALEADPGSKLLKRQMVLLGKSSITTIHSFCLEVIRNNFQYIDLDPNFRIADETEGLLLKMEAMDELFESLYTETADRKANDTDKANMEYTGLLAGQGLEQSEEQSLGQSEQQRLGQNKQQRLGQSEQQGDDSWKSEFAGLLES